MSIASKPFSFLLLASLGAAASPEPPTIAISYEGNRATLSFSPVSGDHREDFGASGREWRTPPLWGIGLTEEALPQARYLHDGRARTLLEAILWHGGEAEAARERFRQLSSADREALLAFLQSL